MAQVSTANSELVAGKSVAKAVDKKFGRGNARTTAIFAIRGPTTAARGQSESNHNGIYVSS